MNDDRTETRVSARQALIACLTAMTWLAGGVSAAAADGDPEAGRIKSETCKGCHGSAGYKNIYPMYNVPKLVGLSGDYIKLALLAYRTAERDHPTMRSQAGSMTDQDIADIAAYIGSLGQ